MHNRFKHTCFWNKSWKRGLLIQAEIALKMRIISAYLKGNFKYAFDLNGGLGWQHVLWRCPKGGTGGRPTCLCDKSRPRARDPFPLKDPDEDRPVHWQACCAVSFRCQGGKIWFYDSETVSSVETLFFEKVARAYQHNHISIAYWLCYVK